MPKLLAGQSKVWADRMIQQRLQEGQERRDLILGLRRQRFMRLKAHPPEAYQRYLGQGIKVPISYRLIETILGTVASKPPVFHLTSPDPELARRGSKWCALNMQVQERISQRAQYLKFWDELLSAGLVALKTQRHIWADFPERGEDQDDEGYNRMVEDFLGTTPAVPWRTRTVSGDTFFPPRSEWESNYVVESGLRPTEAAYRQLGLIPKGSGNLGFLKADDLRPIKQDDSITPLNMSMLRAAPQVQVDELWTEDDLFVRVGSRIYQYDNDLGRIPYEWCSGATIAFDDPTLQAMSVQLPLAYLEPWLNQFLSIMVAHGTVASTANLFIEQDARGSVGGQGEPQVADIPVGRQVTFAPGQKARWVAPPLDANAITLFSNLVTLAKEFTISPTPGFAGTRTPGTVISQVAERTLAVLTPRVSQAERTLERQAKFYIELMQRLGVPISVSGMVFQEKAGRTGAATTALSPRDAKKIGDVLCKISFRTSTDQIAWNTMAVMMAQSRLWSRQRSMREAGVDDPEQEKLDITLEDLESSPAVQLYEMQQALGDEEPLAAIQEAIGQMGGAQEIGQAMQGGNGARPDENPRAEGGRVPGEARAAGGERGLTPNRFLG